MRHEQRFAHAKLALATVDLRRLQIVSQRVV